MHILQKYTPWLITLAGLVVIAGTTHTWLHILCFIVAIIAWRYRQTPVQTSQTHLSNDVKQPHTIQIKFDQVGHQLTTTLKEETRVVHDTMATIKQLLHESSEQLHSSFHHVLSNANLQRHKAGELVEAHSAASHATAIASDMDKIADTIDKELHKCIQAIQFEDIVSQLCAGIQCRLDHINKTSATVFPDTTDNLNIADHLDHASGALLKLREQFHTRRLDEKVTQSSMAEGDIELF